MTELSVLTVFAGLPVRDLAASIDWYGDVLGRSPDAQPSPQIVDYYLADDHVPEHGTLQLRQDADRAGGGMVTINVADLAPIAERLAASAVPFESVTFPIEAETVSAVTVGTFTDPDGNAVTVVQPHPRG